MSTGPVLIISGTNRPGSNALKVSKELERLYREQQAAAELYSLEQLPPEIFQGSVYATKPPAMIELQNRIFAAAGLHIVSPEYNGSFPGVLKYFIDLLKFPESFENKPVAYVGESSGAWGGLRAIEQLQMIFGYRNAHSYPLRVFIPNVKQMFDAQGRLTDPVIVERLSQQVKGFLRYIQRFSAAD